MVCVHVHGRDVQVYISILMHTFIAQIEFMSQHTNTHTPSHTKHRLLMHESYTVDVNRMTIALILHMGQSPYSSQGPLHPFLHQVDLKKLGILSYGDLATGGLGNCNNNKLELFYPNRVE